MSQSKFQSYTMPIELQRTNRTRTIAADVADFVLRLFFFYTMTGVLYTARAKPR